jgi:protein disulfide-isomerase A1
MQSIFLILALCFFCVFAEEDAAVIELKGDSFDSTIAEGKWLIEFFAPWCGHCKQLLPQFEKAAKHFAEKPPPPANMGKLDCTTPDGQKVCEKFGIQGFPTIKFFNKGKHVEDYDGARKEDALIAYIEKMSLPALRIVTNAEDLEAARKADVVIIGFFDTGVLPAFEQAAEGNRNARWVAVTNGPLSKVQMDALPEEHRSSIVMFRKFDDPIVAFNAKDADVNADTLVAWSKELSVPLIGELGPDTWKTYVAKNIPMLDIFVEPTKADQLAVRDALRPVARAMKGKLSAVFVDAVKYGRHAESLGVTARPGICIHDPNKDKKYVYAGTSLEPAAVQQWCNDVVDGKIEPFYKSEPVPDSQPGPVTVVVGRTFDAIVKDATKDVFLEIYAPWCGHCKALAPKYEEVAKHFKDSPTVVIAKVDGTANDMPGVQIRGFPTLIFFPANHKDKPLSYSGDRETEAIIKYINENGDLSQKAEEATEPKTETKEEL